MFKHSSMVKVSPTKENVEMVLDHLKTWDIESMTGTYETIDITKPSDKWKVLKPGRRTMIFVEKDKYSDDKS